MTKEKTAWKKETNRKWKRQRRKEDEGGINNERRRYGDKLKVGRKEEKADRKMEKDKLTKESRTVLSGAGPSAKAKQSHTSVELL